MSWLVVVLPTPTDVGDVRVKSLVPGPPIMSPPNTVPEFPAAAPVLKLTETGETGQGGVGPVSAAVMVAPGLTLEPNPGVHTKMEAWAGAVIKGAMSTKAPAVAKSLTENIP